MKTAAFEDRGVNKLLRDDADDLTTPVPGEDLLDDDNTVLPYSSARAVRETFVARKARLDFHLANNELVAIEEVSKVVQADYAVVRERFLTLAAKVANKCVGKTTP